MYYKMSSVIDRIILGELVTSEEVESLNSDQKPHAYGLIYSYIPIDRYYTTVTPFDVNLDHFADSPVFQEFTKYNNSIKNINTTDLREFIENYPESALMTKDFRENQLFIKCNVIKSLASIYFNEMYTMQTIQQFPTCWKILAKGAFTQYKKLKKQQLIALTQHEIDCIIGGKFIRMYDTYAHKASGGWRRDASSLAYIMREIISLCDYSDRLSHFKSDLLLKYYAITNDHESSAQIQLDNFNKYHQLDPLFDVIVILVKSKQYVKLEQLLLQNLEVCYTLAQSYRGEFIVNSICIAVANCSVEFRHQMELIFNNYFRKLMVRHQKRTVYFPAFILDSECLICCKITDCILRCVACNKSTCCMLCAYRVNVKKCMLCRSVV